MDDLLQKFLQFPPHPPPAHPLSDERYDEGIKSQVDAVKKMSDAKLLQQTSGGENALDVINPALNSAPYACLLTANISALKKNSTKGMSLNALYEKIETFLISYDARQIRYVGSEFATIIESFADMAHHKQTPWAAVGVIATALLKLDPSGAMLTSSHLILVKLALTSRNYNHAIPLLEKYILYFPGTKDQPKPKYLCDMNLNPAAYITPDTKLTTKLKYQDLLEYFLFSGMVFIGARKWEAALQCLENAVTYPAKENTVSKIMVEAYKKWVLVGILVEGKLLPLPKSTSGGAAKTYHILAKPHETLAQIFENGTASRLKAEAEASNTTFWHGEGNTGLVLAVLAAYQRFQIRNLANVYSKISIQEVIKETTSAETGAKLASVGAGEQLVRNMINQGELHATLGTSPTGQPILTFSPGGKLLTEVEMKRELAASTIRIKALINEIKTTDRLLTHDKEYIKYTQKLKKSGDAGGDQGISVMQDFHDAVEDEDIMSMY